MKKKNLVSIIMNCHNGEKYLHESISSVIKQTYKNWELIFFDNQSIDKSKNIALSFNDKRIKYFKSKYVNLGIARKKAMGLCKGEYLAFLDCDDLWHKDKLKDQLNVMKRHTNVGLCFSNSIFFKKNYRRKLYSKKPYDGYIFENLLRKYFISFDTVFINLKKLKKFNLNFDERFTITHDLDLLTRFSMKSEFKYIDKVLSYWRIHGTSFSKNKISVINNEKKLFLKKLNKILKNKKHKNNYINLFKRNLEETKMEEYISKGNTKKIHQFVFKGNNFNFKNFIIFLLMFIPAGKNLIMSMKKS